MSLVSQSSENRLGYYRATPSDPTGATSSTGVMMGLAGAFTPVKSGKLDILITGNISNSASGGGGSVTIRWGTGSAPANGDALTGTIAGKPSGIVNAALALLVPGSGNFTCMDIISGLTLNTEYWFDVSVVRAGGGTATINNVVIKIVEL